MNSPICLACGSARFVPHAKAKDVEYFTSDTIYEYFFCTDCRTLSIFPVPEDLLDLIYPKNYYSFGAQKQGFVLRIKIALDQLIFKKILKLIGKPSINVLDVGGGEGWLLDVLASIPCKMDVAQIVDLNEQAGARAIEKGYQYHCGRIEKFSSPHKFDLVFMLNLIEHVSKPRDVLMQVHQLLSDGGLVLIKTPNYDSLDARLFKNHNWGGYHCPRHWVLFTMDSFLRLASASGFEVVEKSYTQGAPFWTWSVLHFLHKRGWIKMDHLHPASQHPLGGVLSLIFAAFDFIRLPFSSTSQMFFILRKKRFP